MSLTLSNNVMLLTYIPTMASQEFTRVIEELTSNQTVVTIPANPTHHIPITVEIELSEKSIINTVDALTPFNITIDPDIIDYYNTIRSWDLPTTQNLFLPNAITSTKFQELWAKEHPMSDLRLRDLRIRYQYYLPTPNPVPTNLTETIAYREYPTIIINRKDHTLTEILQSLQTLERFPIMFIFDNLDLSATMADLLYFTDSLNAVGISYTTHDIGILFRLSNKDGREFNQHIASHHYNSPITKNTSIVGIQHSKCPKCLLTSDWYPKAVIGFGPGVYSSSITHAYNSRCDLVIRHHKAEPNALKFTAPTHPEHPL